MFKDLKETVYKAKRNYENNVLLSRQYKEIEIIKMNQMEILELKSTINEMTISLEGLNNIFEQKSCEHNDRSVEIIKSEEQQGKKIKKNEQTFKDLWHIMNYTYLHVGDGS